MSGRERSIDSFLERAGWTSARRAPLAGDASARRYERITKAGATAVLMDAPVEPGEIKPAGYSAIARLAVDCRPFVAVSSHLVTRGLSAPAVYSHAIGEGLLLLEDLGDDLFVRLLGEAGSGDTERKFYETAVDLLAVLHREQVPATLQLPGSETYAVPRYDRAVYQVEADLLIDWYFPALAGRPVTEGERAAYHAAWGQVLPYLEGGREVLTLRDFHAGNLLWLTDRRGVRRVGLLDFQDALIGHPAYDLVSLLQDARRDVSPTLQADMLERYIRRSRRRRLLRFNEADFRRAYAILGVQRNAKIVGIFTRLSKRDGKPVYLRHMPRVWRYLNAGLAHPALAPLAAWFDATIPRNVRLMSIEHDQRFAPPVRAAS